MSERSLVAPARAQSIDDKRQLAFDAAKAFADRVVPAFHVATDRLQAWIKQW